MSAHDHRRLRDLLLDVDDDVLAAALSDQLRPHRRHRVSIRTESDAVAAVGEHPARVVVCAPRVPTSTASTTVPGGVTPRAEAATVPADHVHRRVALRVGWWARAVAVVDARLVVVVVDDLGERGGRDDGVRDESPWPDEFAPLPATGPLGRAWRAAEDQVLRAGGAVVRADPVDDPAAVAGLLGWVVRGRRPGRWHLPGTAAPLDTRHTRLVVRDTGARVDPPPGTRPDRAGPNSTTPDPGRG